MKQEVDLREKDALLSITTFNESGSKTELYAVTIDQLSRR